MRELHRVLGFRYQRIDSTNCPLSGLKSSNGSRLLYLLLYRPESTAS
jgi:hypothetical protein